MLVLTRKPNQQLHIGNDIVITIVKVRGNTIRLGIEAPKDVRVIRSELEPKSGPKSPVETSKRGAGETSLSATLSDDSTEVEPAASDDVQDLIAGAFDTESPVIFKARIKQPTVSRATLKRFIDVPRMPGLLSERNVEDSPLCHCVPQDDAPVLRPSGLHSYIAAKNRSTRPVPSTARESQVRSQTATGLQTQSQPLTPSALTCNEHPETAVQA